MILRTMTLHTAMTWHAATVHPAASHTAFSLSLSHAVAAGSSTDDVTPGVLGFLVIAAMGGALYFLLRSMSKHLRRVRAVHDAGLEPGSDLSGGAVDGGPGGGAPGGGAEPVGNGVSGAANGVASRASRAAGTSHRHASLDDGD